MRADKSEAYAPDRRSGRHRRSVHPSAGGRPVPVGWLGNSWASMSERQAEVVGKVACVRTFGRRGGAMCESALGAVHAGTRL